MHQLYNELAKYYDALYSYRNFKGEAKFLVEQLPSGIALPKILDVACGTGPHLEALSTQLQDVTLAGLDLNRGMLEIARKKVPSAKMHEGDMRDFNLGEKFDLVYCLSSSIQYMLTTKDLERAIMTMAEHAPNGKVVFDLAYCLERWQEGYTSTSAAILGDIHIAEIATSYSSLGEEGGRISDWRPIYFIQNQVTGELRMIVDQHKIRLWTNQEVQNSLRSLGLNFDLIRGFDGNGDDYSIPIYLVEGRKKQV